MSEATDLGFPVKGSFKRTPFPQIVRNLSERGATGSLYLLNGKKTKKVVFFEEGQPVFVRSNVLSECLGQQLAAQGLITQEQCDQTLEAIRRTGKKQGELLVEMGILSEGNLRYGLETQLRTKLFDIFDWTEGKYQFKPGGKKQDFGLRVEHGPRGIIVAAILETYDDARAREALAGILSQFPRANDGVDPEDLGLIPEERYFLSCLDGSRSVAELLDVASDYATPNLAALLYGLYEAGAITLHEEAGPSSPAPPALEFPESARPDVDFAPAYEPTRTVTEYEDTPLPGQLPQRDLELPDEDEEMFAGVEDSKVAELPRAPADEGGPSPAEAVAAAAAAANEAERDTPEVSQDLLDAESDDVDETFDDDEIELVDDDDLLIEDEPEPEPEPELSAAGSSPQVTPRPLGDNLANLEVDDDLALNTNAALEMGEPDGAPSTTMVERGEDDELMGLDDLDGVDLSADDDLALDADDDLALDDDLEGAEDLLDEPEDDPFANQTMEISDVDAEVLDDLGVGDDDGGAIAYSNGEAALAEGRWAEAVQSFEEAYEQGFDVAELHANLAYGRYMASGMDPSMGQHAFELLDYAESMNENLDLVHAYRGTILHAMGDVANARAALQRALQINPYNDLALEVMDAMR